MFIFFKIELVLLFITMSYIPDDIIKLIIEYINFEDAQKLYLVSKGWQYTMEKMEFPEIFRKDKTIDKIQNLFAFKMHFVLYNQSEIAYDKLANLLIINNNLPMYDYLSNIHKNMHYYEHFIIACKYGYLNLVKYLATQQKDDTINDYYCLDNAVGFASKNGHLSIIKYLASKNKKWVISDMGNMIVADNIISGDGKYSDEIVKYFEKLF